jgi:pyrroline-5-carboxylate reductase
VLVGAAEAIGLDRKIALASAHALADGIIAWRAGDLSLEKLLREAATPGGIAEAAVTATLDQAGYRRIVKNGLCAGIRRARKNSER